MLIVVGGHSSFAVDSVEIYDLSTDPGETRNLAEAAPGQAKTLLEALHKYHLLDSFNAVVKGFCNSSPAISALGDTSKITSLSLRSLCKTVLGDTTLPTNSAVDRCTALFSILAKVTEGEDDLVSDSKLLPYSSSVPAEAEALNQLKSVLGTQVNLHTDF